MNFHSLHSRLSELPSVLRERFLFASTGVLRSLIPVYPSKVSISRGVQLQRLACLGVDEHPESQIEIQQGVRIYENARIRALAGGRIEVGERSILGDLRLYARERIRLGRGTLTSWNVFIQDYDPHPTDPALRAAQVEQMLGVKESLEWSPPSAPIDIGDNCWLGANTTVLKGASIGSGCVVAVGSVVVAGEYPENSLLAGSPARVVKSFS